jgi:hypothetical protein
MTTATNKTNIGTRRCTVASEEEVMGRMRLIPFGPTQCFMLTIHQRGLARMVSAILSRARLS